VLPDVAPALRADAARRLAARPAWGIDAAAQDAIVAETLRVLEDPAFAAVFAPGSRAEVPVVGAVGPFQVAGQIDRLAVTASDVLIVDYKTNRPPPRAVEDVDPAYVSQLAAYREVLRPLWPGRALRCLLLWTDGPFAMELPPAMLDPALARLTSAGP
jgi:ATP-dependent helicase/nuclease subunit A